MAFLGLALGISLFVHVATLFGLRFVDVRVSAAAPPTPAEIDFIDMEAEPEPEPEPEVEEPEPEVEEPEPEPERPDPPVRREQEEPDEPAPAPLNEETPPEPPPEVLDGVTLTGDGSFVMEGGSGASRMNPIENRPRAGRPDGQEGGTGTGGTGMGGPQVVPVRNLSRRPEPPTASTIARCLEENYPRAARRQGLSGVAAVRAQIGPSGAVSNLSVRSESVAGEGFGQACIRCLRGRPWSPPLSRGGQPVSTRITYTCDFVVRQ